VVAITDNLIPHEKGKMDIVLTKYFIPPVDGFIYMSKAVANDFDKIDRTKQKIYNPHPLYDNYGEIISRKEALTNLKLDDGYRYLLFFGFVRDYKGLDILLRAMSAKMLRAFKLKLLVIGEFYTDIKPYKNMIVDLGLEDLVYMPNEFVPNNMVSNYFCAADVIVQPYKTATQSGVTQVAYHFNKPIITTNVGGLAEYVKDEYVGYAVPPEDGAVAEAIYKFFKLEKEQAFVENVKEYKQVFTWDKLIESIYAVQE